jgi:trehalose 6-phosphate phosphatase
VTVPAERLAPWLRHPSVSGVLTDFDGTVAPIVPDPAAAVPLPGIGRVLARLAERYARVAVISGRPVAYLVGRLGPCPGVILCGLYGLEQARDGIIAELPAAAPWRATVERVARAAEGDAPAGVGVERKGLSVVLHFRTVPSLAGWARSWAAGQAAGSGLVVHEAKMAVELLPPIPTDKGTVVEQLAEGLARVCYLGDDRGDLPAFAALAALAGRGVEALAVVVDSDETPPEVRQAADVIVSGPEGALALLAVLAGDPCPTPR